MTYVEYRVNKLKSHMMDTSKDFGAITNELCTVKKVLKRTLKNSVPYACFYDGGELGSTDVIKT